MLDLWWRYDNELHHESICNYQKQLLPKNNRELSKTTMQNIHIWFKKHTTWQYCKQFTSNLTSIDPDNIFSNNQISIQMKWVKKYTSWNIKMKPMMLETYTSRCRKLHLKLSTLPMCSDGWNQGVAYCTKVWVPCYFCPFKWPRLTGAFGASLPVVANVTWNLYQMKCLFIKQISVEIYISFNTTLNLYQIWNILQTYTR